MSNVENKVALDYSTEMEKLQEDFIFHDELADDFRFGALNQLERLIESLENELNTFKSLEGMDTDLALISAQKVALKKELENIKRKVQNCDDERVDGFNQLISLLYQYTDVELLKDVKKYLD